MRGKSEAERDRGYGGRPGVSNRAALGVSPGAHAAYEQIYFSSPMPRTYLCARLLETLD